MNKPSSLVAQTLIDSRTILLTTHKDPDGDGLGAATALYHALCQLGKDVRLIINDPVPRRYSFLCGIEVSEVYNADLHDVAISDAGAIVLLDAATPSRTGRMHRVLLSASGRRVVIDHHPTREWGDVKLVDTKAASTCELVEHMVRALGVELTPQIAEALYVGMVYDTQCFMTPNTTSITHKLAARMLTAGASLERVHDALFGSWPKGRLGLQGRFLSGLKSDTSGRISWGIIRQKDLHKYQVDPSVLDGFVNMALSTAGTELAILFIEGKTGEVGLSFRGRGGVVVNRLAESFGGGGHRRAAGASVKGDIEIIVGEVLQAATDLLFETN